MALPQHHVTRVEFVPDHTPVNDKGTFSLGACNPQRIKSPCGWLDTEQKVAIVILGRHIRIGEAVVSGARYPNQFCHHSCP